MSFCMNRLTLLLFAILINSYRIHCWNEFLSQETLSHFDVTTADPALNGPLFNFVGCYNDRREARDIGDRDFSYLTKFNKSIPTVELCVQLCAQDGFKVAGVQAFDECYCGNTYGRYNSTDNANCFFQCAGKYTCGGYNANSVYFISNVNTKINGNSIESTQSTDLLNPCSSSPCLNSGMCITLMDDKGVNRGFLCRCSNPQDSGTFCEDRNYCFSAPCLNGGTCTNSLNGFICTCPLGWSGLNCNNPSNMMLSTEFTPLGLNCFDEGRKCLNGGSCLKGPNDLYYTCKCPINYSGPTCEVYDVCSSKPCQNDGVCVFKPPSFYECNCTGNYYGYACEKLNPCKNDTCQNGGVCRINFSNNEYFCLCEGNFIGRNCDQCKPQFTGPFCDQCISGFTGVNCDQLLTFCTPNPCINGICLWDASGYKCVCTEGWRGRICNEKNCLLKSCLNEGICTTIYENNTNQIDYKCSCPIGFYGEQCEFQDIDPCLSNPCSLGEDCIISTESTSSYMCVLSNNFCERMKPCNNNSECVYSKENNTFYCRCLNGAPSCESILQTSSLPQQTSPVPKVQATGVSDLAKNVQTNTKKHTEIPKLGFNYENLYWLLPLGLVILVVLLFLSIVTYFGLKARSRTAKFSKKPSNIRNIHYVNDNMTFDENLKPIPSVSNSSLSYSNRSDKEYAEGYGRV